MVSCVKWPFPSSGLLCADEHSCEQLRLLFTKTPAILFPVGSHESYGTALPVGAGTCVATALAHRVASRTRLPVAAPLNYGYSTPYSAFSGCAGMKPRSLSNAVGDCLRTWRLQGVRTVVLINGSYDNHDPLREACDRVGGVITTKLYSWQCMPSVHTLLRSWPGWMPSYGRMEKALYSMIAYLQPALIQPVPHKSIPPSDAAPYTQWRKRGKDPEKFRALYPHGTVSLGRPPDMQTAAPRGETLFFHIATAIENEIRTGDYRGDN